MAERFFWRLRLLLTPAWPSGTHTKDFGKDVHACGALFSLVAPHPRMWHISKWQGKYKSTTKLHLQLVNIDFPPARPSITLFTSSKLIFRSLRYTMRKLRQTERLSIANLAHRWRQSIWLVLIHWNCCGRFSERPPRGLFCDANYSCKCAVWMGRPRDDINKSFRLLKLFLFVCLFSIKYAAK